MVFVLARAIFREHAAPMDILEIPIEKFVVSLGVIRSFVVDSQLPFAVLGETVEAKNSVSLLADGRCSLHASRSSNTTLPFSMSSLARPNALRLSVTGIAVSFQVLMHPTPYRRAMVLPRKACTADQTRRTGCDGCQFPDH